MSKRGRVSMSELMTPENPLEVIQRPDAPYELDDEESAEWRAQVAAMPADHFTRSTFPLLIQLCRHTVASNRIHQLVDQAMKPGRGKKFEIRTYTELLKAQALETAQINRLLRAMRLTQQSTIKAETLGRRLKNAAPFEKAPWDKDDE